MKRTFLKSEVSIDKDSKREYLDERICELLIDEVVDIDASNTLLF